MIYYTMCCTDFSMHGFACTMRTYEEPFVPTIVYTLYEPSNHDSIAMQYM
jgi:hypothetical protein